MDKIKILLVDDQNMFRDGMRVLLNSQPDFTVVGEAGNGEEAISKAAVLKPQVILMDLRMPIMDGSAATRYLKINQPECRVIALTTFDEDAEVFDALRAGAIGYLLKDASTEKLYEAIRAASKGESVLQPSVAARLVAQFSRLSESAPRWAQELSEPLSPREMDVLRLMASGSSNREISEKLVLAEGTVKNHITNIFTKLGVNDRTRAVIKAQELGLV
jgi:DNA-binding NarL/FixJ family response regulator